MLAFTTFLINHKPSILNPFFNPFRLSSLAILLFSGFLVTCNSREGTESHPQNMPRVLDQRLTLSLLAEDPDIVTPIGIAIDNQDRIYVLESHTHQPPMDYQGPKGDQIKIFKNKDGGNSTEEISIYAEGFKEGVNIAFSPEGVLYVVTSRAVFALYDRNNDGVSDEKIKVVELTEPNYVYAHAALLGITFSKDGWMYISRGNTGSSSWILSGSDKSSISGYGDGGNIFRARLDGSQLEEVATGFWNPVDLKFDQRGRLLVVDNDPDSRGPNRLVHVVPGGDYGYKSLYGGSGIHPYLAWNGELPGTLPYAVALGEAPSGMLNASQTALPQDYQGQMLATIWEESRIVRIHLTPKGVSIGGKTEIIIEGDQDFRPVAFASDSKGNIYFTDWVLRDYPNHGRGKIWKLATNPMEAKNRSDMPQNVPLPNWEGNLFYEIYDINSIDQIDQVLQELKSNDSFLRHAAVMVLSRPSFHPHAVKATLNSDPKIRLGALLALERGDFQNPGKILSRLLKDPDPEVRRMAMIWTGRKGLLELRPELDGALIKGSTSPELFETYLETIKQISPDFIKSYKEKSKSAKEIERKLPTGFLESFIIDPTKPAELRALALKNLKEKDGKDQLLIPLLDDVGNLQLQMEAVLSSAEVSSKEIGEKLLTIAINPSQPAQLRAEAILSLSRQPGDHSTKLIPLLKGAQSDIQIEIVRYLRTRLRPKDAEKHFLPFISSLKKDKKDPLQQQLALALSNDQVDKNYYERPDSPDGWKEVLASGGNFNRGRRVFNSVQSSCFSCHVVQGRGGDLGPDLSNVGLSKSRPQLISAILDPSAEISPEYQGWYIKVKNGKNIQGRQIDVGGEGIKLYTHSGGFISIPKEEILDYGMIETSLMPGGLEAQLTESDLWDLLTFLEKVGLENNFHDNSVELE